jgi:hypothetical protein
MADVPSNLIGTRKTQLPQAPLPASADSIMDIVYQGNSYQIRVGDILTTLGPVPSTRNITAGTGLSGGGPLSSDVTINISPEGVGNSELTYTGVLGGVYGDQSHIPVFTVDSKGRVSSAKHVSVVSDAATMTGVLSTEHGGTSKNMTLANGGVVWSGADGLYVGPVGMPGQVFVSGGSGAPAWGSALVVVDQPANVVYAGPVGGLDAPTTFRHLANTDLPDSGAEPNTYGSGTQIPVVTVNAKGVVTTISTAAVASVPNAVTFTNTGGEAAGVSFDGSAAKIVDYHTVGAAPSGSYAFAPDTNTDTYIPQWGGNNTKTLKEGLAVPAGGLAGLTVVGTKQDKLTVVPVKTTNYSANASEYVPCDISLSGITVTLPSAPPEGTVVQTKIIKTDSTTVLEIRVSGADVFNKVGGETSVYQNLLSTVCIFTYQASTKIWYADISAPGSAFAMQFPGIDAQTPITNYNISIDTTSRVLTITPPLGYFYINIDGNGRNTRIRKTGVTPFPAFTDTSGTWYFYFNSSGVAVTTQTPVSVDEFSLNASVYRIVWNASLSGAAKLVAQYIEYHTNTIPAAAHRWFHLQGAQWRDGLLIKNNAITSGAPNVDGRNTVISVTSGAVIDDNLEYTVTNSTAGTPWTQDMGNTLPASLTLSNSGMFRVFLQSAGGLVSFTTATRFPFPYSAGNVMEYVTAAGVRTQVSNTQRWAVVFVYSSPNPVSGDAVKVVSATTDFSSLTNARAYNWVDIQNVYPLFGTDFELRPLYRLIYEVHPSTPTQYDSAVKCAVLRETQDLRKAIVTNTTASTGSVLASSVVVIPAGGISATNAQSALEELDTEKANLISPSFTTPALGTPTSGDFSSGTFTWPIFNVDGGTF